MRALQVMVKTPPGRLGLVMPLRRRAVIDLKNPVYLDKRGYATSKRQEGRPMIGWPIKVLDNYELVPTPELEAVPF